MNTCKKSIFVVTVFLFIVLGGTGLLGSQSATASAAMQDSTDVPLKIRRPNADFFVYLPIAFSNFKPNRGIFGTVYYKGIRASGYQVDLNESYNTAPVTTSYSMQSTVVSTTFTADDGTFYFVDAPVPLKDGRHFYYVRISSNPNRNEPYTWWETAWLRGDIYTTTAKYDLGKFDIADRTILDPLGGATITLPYTFRVASPSSVLSVTNQSLVLTGFTFDTAHFTVSQGNFAQVKPGSLKNATPNQLAFAHIVTGFPPPNATDYEPKMYNWGTSRSISITITNP